MSIMSHLLMMRDNDLEIFFSLGCNCFALYYCTQSWYFLGFIWCIIFWVARFRYFYLVHFLEGKVGIITVFVGMDDVSNGVFGSSLLSFGLSDPIYEDITTEGLTSVDEPQMLLLFSCLPIGTLPLSFVSLFITGGFFSVPFLSEKFAIFLSIIS